MSKLYIPLLAPLLRWFASLSWSDFNRVVDAVRGASKYWLKSPEMTDAEKASVNAYRAQHVRDFIARTWPKISGWVLNLVLELAVGWFNRTTKGGRA